MTNDFLDIPMICEKLARDAFNVERFGDPEHMVDAGFFERGDFLKCKTLLQDVLRILNERVVLQKPEMQNICSEFMEELKNADNREKLFDVVREYYEMELIV